MTAADHYRSIEPEDALLALDRIGLAMAVIRDSGCPTTAEEHAEVLHGAREMMAESFTRRGIPDPPGGWAVWVLSPEAYWRPFLAPNVAREVDADLATRPNATVVVLFAVALDTASGRM